MQKKEKGTLISYLFDVEARYIWARRTTDIFSAWSNYFGCPTCALIMCMLHEEIYLNLLENNQKFTSVRPISSRAVAERLGISNSTAHRKLKKILNDKIFEFDGKNFRFALDENSMSVVRKVLPEVGTKIDSMISSIQKTKNNTILYPENKDQDAHKPKIKNQSKSNHNYSDNFKSKLSKNLKEKKVI